MSALSFYGHGKLLISAEYFVLDGALALALPTKFGQHLRVQSLTGENQLLYWVALNSKKQPWLKAVFNTTDFSVVGEDNEVTERLTKVLTETRKLNPSFLIQAQDLAVETLLEFPNEWGLGSSSTFIYCMAEWAQVDGYTLLQNTLGGSGYDVACAGSDEALLYQLDKGKPVITTTNWQPSFRHQLYFAYLGKKKLSSDAIKFYREQLADRTSAIQELTDITKAMLSCDKISDFESLVNRHEEIISSRLHIKKVKEELFPDFEGSVKSLGAWGGDFVLLTYSKSREELAAYLKAKNISTFFSWEEIIL